MPEQTSSAMAPVISIVDDDKAVRDALQRMLRAHGFTTAVFASAEELLASDERYQTACLILDVRMPEMTITANFSYVHNTGYVLTCGGDD